MKHKPVRLVALQLREPKASAISSAALAMMLIFIALQAAALAAWL